MTFVKYPVLEHFNEIVHFCTTRSGGISQGNYASFNITSYTGDKPGHQQVNLRKLIDFLEISPENLVFPVQTHSDNILLIDTEFYLLNEEERSLRLHGVDALITAVQGICIGVTTADCVPLLMFDSVNKVVAAVHAGWRGTCSRIAEKTLRKMTEIFGTNPTDVFISIGVSISPEVYNVGVELISEFEKQQFPVNDIFIRRHEQLYLDLWRANKWLLSEAGVPEHQIEVSGHCSYTQHELYFSARRLGIKSGRMLSAIMIK